MTTKTCPTLHFAFEARLTVGAPRTTEASGITRRVIPILDGNFKGAGLKGIVLAGGADWQIVHSDGTTEVDARYDLQTDDGSIISVENRGLRRGPAAVLQKLLAGEGVDPSTYYFRTAAFFRTVASSYRWLSESVFVGDGERYPDRVVIRFCRVE
jgi:hypothetical protein